MTTLALLAPLRGEKAWCAMSTLESIEKIERRAKLTEQLGHGSYVQMMPSDLLGFCMTARAVLSEASEAAVAKKALTWRWALWWFAIGAIFERVLR